MAAGCWWVLQQAGNMALMHSQLRLVVYANTLQGRQMSYTHLLTIAVSSACRVADDESRHLAWCIQVRRPAWLKGVAVQLGHPLQAAWTA